MTLHMNGPFAQLAALGVIGVVALFPSPDQLKDAVQGNLREPARLELAAVEDGFIIEPASLSVSTAPVELEVPDIRGCRSVKDQPVAFLNTCAASLSRYIDTQDPQLVAQPDPLLGSVVIPDQTVEEARSALATICRVQWGREQAGTGFRSDACASLR